MAGIRTEYERYLDKMTVEDCLNMAAVGMAFECNDGCISAIVQEGETNNEKLHTKIRNTLVSTFR